MILAQSINQVSIVLILNYAGRYWIHRQETLKSFIFNVFIFLQLFNEVNCRELGTSINCVRGLHRNRFFAVIWVLTVGAQVLLMQFGGKYFHTVPISAILWLASVAIGTSSIFVGMFVRLVVFRIIQARQTRKDVDQAKEEPEGQNIRLKRRDSLIYNAVRRPHSVSLATMKTVHSI